MNEVAADGADLKLPRPKTSPRSSRTASGWASMPATTRQKGQLLNCVGCHTLERIVRSTHDADTFMKPCCRACRAT
jgi:hypothetical protein